MQIVWLTLWVCSAAGLALVNQRENPVEKVIVLLQDLEKQVKDEGVAEAGLYHTFACFCKDTTKTKSESITNGQDTIDTLSANIQQATAAQATKQSDLSTRQVAQEESAAQLRDEQNRCLKEAAEFGAKVAELTKAVDSLDKAITAMKASKPASLLALKDSIGQNLALADAMSLIKPAKKEAVQAFLQQGVDPSDAEYKYHSAGIIQTLEDLHNDFASQKTTTQSEWDKASTGCSDLKKSLTDEMDSNANAMGLLKEDIDGLKTKIAEDRESLMNAESGLQDDQTYLKDLTVRCESRAKTWDQRSILRGKEIEALAQALEILNNKVKDLDAVNVRSMLVQNARLRKSNSSKSPVFFQQTSRRLRIRHYRRAEKQLLRGDEARNMLLAEAERLQSPLLSALAARVTADPFAKVKTLIQGLIERLLKEATEEATKKGFCDTELGKATQSRDFRFAESEKISAELASLEARRDSLTEEIQRQAESANQTAETLNIQAAARAAEKQTNLETLRKAREGLTAISEAISILKVFYKESAKAKVLLQASPVDVDDPGAGFSDAYKGKLDSSTGIIGLLEVIKSDFERTVRTINGDEKNAAADHIDFDRMSKADIAEKEKGAELNTQSLESTRDAIKQKTNDLQTAQGLLDEALKSIEDLKPMCIDNVMSYAERVTKRQEEIAALKKALCYLDPNQNELECQGR